MKFKFHIGKKSKKKTPSTSSYGTTPSSPNNAHHGETTNSAEIIIAPNVREEAQLMDNDTFAGDRQTSGSSLEVEPGNDPLSLITSSGEGEGGETTIINSMTKSESILPSEHWQRQSGARYGACLSNEDHTNLRSFVYELVGRRLLPHLNEALKSLNEWVSL